MSKLSILAAIQLDFKRYTARQFTYLMLFRKFLSSPNFRAVVLYRVGHKQLIQKRYILTNIIQRLMHFFCHCYISCGAEIGAGFLIGHVGGIVIGSGSVIGANCDIRQNVTLGGNYKKKSSDGKSQPTLGDNVSVGAGAVIVGPVLVGDGAIVGANSLVNRDVPEYTIVLGVPAKVVKQIWSEAEGRSL